MIEVKIKGEFYDEKIDFEHECDECFILTRTNDGIDFSVEERLISTGHNFYNLIHSYTEKILRERGKDNPVDKEGYFFLTGVCKAIGSKELRKMANYIENLEQKEGDFDATGLVN